MAECLEGLAGIAAAQGQPERAARLSGAAEALRDSAGVPLPADGDHERDVVAARAALGEERFAAAWAAGGERRRGTRCGQRFAAAWAAGRELTWEEALAEVRPAPDRA